MTYTQDHSEPVVVAPRNTDEELKASGFSIPAGPVATDEATS